MIVDYHMHLRRPGGSADVEDLDHTVEAVERYVEVATDRGVDEIGFTEHVYYFRETRPLWHVPYQVDRCRFGLEPYVEAVVEGKRQGLPVKLGLEVDYVPGREDETRALLEPYPWDYLLGSIHFIDGFGVDGPPRLIDEVGVEEAWRRYFAVLGAAAASGLFDALSHPDLIKIFGNDVAGDVIAELHEQAANAIGEAGTAVEVSTAGTYKPTGRLYPDAELLRACREHGVAITLASDAHLAENVGRDLERAVSHARAAGYDTVTVFDGRRARQEPLG